MRNGIIPGLAETRAHIPPPSTTLEHIEETLFLYLFNGITTTRVMLDLSEHLCLRKRVKYYVIELRYEVGKRNKINAFLNFSIVPLR